MGRLRESNCDCISCKSQDNITKLIEVFESKYLSKMPARVAVLMKKFEQAGRDDNYSKYKLHCVATHSVLALPATYGKRVAIRAKSSQHSTLLSICETLLKDVTKIKNIGAKLQKGPLSSLSREENNCLRSIDHLCTATTGMLLIAVGIVCFVLYL